MTNQPIEVSEDLARVLDQLSGTTKGDSMKKSDIEKLAEDDSRQFVRCQWLGQCYYCYFANTWWRIGCM
jgi:hypothetical protein